MINASIVLPFYKRSTVICNFILNSLMNDGFGELWHYSFEVCRKFYSDLLSVHELQDLLFQEQLYLIPEIRIIHQP